MGNRRGTDGRAFPLVSVVIPTYDRNERLPAAVESVAGQTYDHVELLIVDDGSPVPVTETLTDPPSDGLSSITFIRHDTNRGANVARNSGIRAATGEYIAFLDDDDCWHEMKLGKQVEAFLSSTPDVGVVCTGVRRTDERGTSTSVPTVEGDVTKDILTGAGFGQFSSVMVRSDAIDDAGLPDERFPAWQDLEWFLRLSKNHQFKTVREILTHRHADLPDRITRDFEQKRDVAYPLFIDKHYDFAKTFGLYYARSFVAALRMDLAWSAIKADRYGQARQFFWSAFFANPLHRPTYPNLLPSLGGKLTYESAVSLRRRLTSLRSSLGKLR